MVKALEHYTEAYRTSKNSNNKRGIGISLNNMGVAYHKQGHQAKALELLLASLSIKRELGNQKDVAISLHNLGLVYHKMNQYPKALSHFYEAPPMYTPRWAISNRRCSTMNVRFILHRR